MAGIAGWAVPAPGTLDEAGLVPMVEALAGRAGARGAEPLVCYSGRRRHQQVVLGAALCDAGSGIALALDGGLADAAALRAQLAAKGFAFSAAGGAAEVLLRAYQYWDKDVVKQLRGAFAFALWDPRKDRLMLARDRFGERPLHVHERAGGVFFASEAKALLAAPGARAALDRRALRACIAHGYAAGPGTLFRGLRRLPPGAYAMWQFGRLQETRYWVPPDRNPGAAASGRGTVEGFTAALAQSARSRAEGREPAGVLLSGGIDSAALVAVLARDGRALKTFSLGFEGDRRSELPQAAAVAKHFGTAHRDIVVKPAELLPGLDALVARHDAPVSPSHLALQRLAAEAGRGATGVLSGDGCDEVVGGYRRMIAERIHPGYCRSIREKRERRAALLLPFAEEERREGAGEARRPPAADADPGASSLRRALYEEQTTRLPGALLERDDRAGIDGGIAIGLPYLDHSFAEYVSGLPDDLRVRRLATKWILREAARHLVPRAIGLRKGGFRLPVRDWLRNELRDTLLDHLQGGASQTRRYYDAALLDRLVGEHVAGRKNHDAILWTLLNLEIWHRRYRPA